MTDDGDITIDDVLADLCRRAGWDAAALWAPDHTRQVMVGVATWADERSAQFAEETVDAILPVAGSMIGEVWAEGHDRYIERIDSHPGFVRRDLLVSSHLHTALLCPIEVSGQRICVLELLAASDPPDVTTDPLTGALDGLGGLIAARIDADRARRQTARLDLALRAGRMGTWEWDRRSGLVLWSDSLEAIYGFEAGTFPSTFDAYAERIHPDDRAATLAELTRTMEAGSEHHVVHRIVRTDGAVRWIEGHGRPAHDARGGLLGLFGVAVDVTEREQLVGDLARQVSLTEAALEDRSAVADTLQRSLLPERLPAPDGLEVATAYRSGRDLVGGDFFHVFEHGGDVFAVLGDVCGKGAPAAALTGLARFSIRGMVAAHMRQPAMILRRLNRVLLEERDDHRFVTAVLARLTRDGPRWKVTLCRAGHPLPVVRRADGTVRFVRQRSGTVLGAFAEIDLVEQTLVLEAGDGLLLYTDGVSEARRGDEQFGDDRLRAALGDASSAEAMVQRVQATVEEFDGGLAGDDLALLAVVAV